MMSALTRKGHARLEKIQFDLYNESSVFQKAVEGYYQRTGHYPARALADQIYRTRKNRDYCKEHGIRMSGPKSQQAVQKSVYQRGIPDNTDRIEVERFFSLDKRCSGAGLIMTRLSDTTPSSIALSVFVTNLFRNPCRKYFFALFCGKRKRIRFHPFHRIRSSVTSLRGYPKRS